MEVLSEAAAEQVGAPSSANSRQLILESAIRVLAREGTHGARVEEIAAEAGVSLGLLNYHFGNRRALLRAGLASGVHQRPVREGSSLAELLASGLLDGDEEMRGWWRIRQETLRVAAFDPELRAAATGATTAWTVDVAARLGGGPNALRNARLVVALLDGLHQRLASGIMRLSEAESLLDDVLTRIAEEG